MAAKLNGYALLVLLVLVSSCGQTAPPTHEVLQLGGDSWNLELAVGDEAIALGLMTRESVPPGTGMLFLFSDSEVHSFWMGYCVTDIDVIFLDGMGRITAAHEMTTELPRQPGESDGVYRLRMPGYSSVYPIRVAIELPPGTIQRLQLEPGQATGIDMASLETLRAKVVRLRR